MKTQHVIYIFKSMGFKDIPVSHEGLNDEGAPLSKPAPQFNWSDQWSLNSGQFDGTYRCSLDAIYILPHSIFVDSLIPSLHQVLLLLIPFLKSCLLPVFSLPPVFVIKDWFSCDNLVVFIVLISFRKWLVPMVQYRSMILTRILPLLARRQQFDNFTHLEFKLVIKAYKRSIV